MTYEEARRKLERAVDKTDLESDANGDKANRGLRKRKHFTDLSSSEDETDENPTKVGKSDSASHKGNSLVLPTFTFSLLPEETGKYLYLFYIQLALFIVREIFIGLKL